jgi:hypothetical protein
VQLAWLQRQNLFSQPYEQLAATLRRAGDDEEAKKVLIKENEKQAKEVPLRVNRLGDWIWYRIVGPIIDYGYRPWKAFLISIGVILFGWLLFWLGSRLV